MKTALTSAQYWEWRTTIAESEAAKEKLKSVQLEAKLLQKEAENFNTKIQLFISTKVEAAKTEMHKAFADYDKMKQRLEESLGESLNNKVIDPITYEVKTLDAPEPPKKD